MPAWARAIALRDKVSPAVLGLWVSGGKADNRKKKKVARRGAKPV